MRKVILTMDENDKYTTIKKSIETNGSKQRVHLYLGCSVRHINRMINGYKKYGKSHFIHGNRGKNPTIALDAEIRQTILDFCNYLCLCHLS